MNARPVASLRPTLLARKGGARPAMRSAQPVDLDALTASQNDLARTDLDWNDLGWNDLGEDRPAKPVALTPPKRRERRAAFTLRLDSQRHFRLRLASTLRDCSAQLLVTEALDRFLDSIPQLEALATTARPSTDHS